MRTCPTRYTTISIPSGMAEEIDSLIEEIGFWPSKSAFVREAVVEKIVEVRGWKRRE